MTEIDLRNWFKDPLPYTEQRKVRKEIMADWAMGDPCPECDDSKECSACKGEGAFEHWCDCEFCTEEYIDCKHCDGTGICPVCEEK